MHILYFVSLVYQARFSHIFHPFSAGAVDMFPKHAGVTADYPGAQVRAHCCFIGEERLLHAQHFPCAQSGAKLGVRLWEIIYTCISEETWLLNWNQIKFTAMMGIRACNPTLKSSATRQHATNEAEPMPFESKQECISPAWYSSR